MDQDAINARVGLLTAILVKNTHMRRKVETKKLGREKEEERVEKGEDEEGEEVRLVNKEAGMDRRDVELIFPAQLKSYYASSEL